MELIGLCGADRGLLEEVSTSTETSIVFKDVTEEALFVQFSATPIEVLLRSDFLSIRRRNDGS
jgi:hypothetical protein